MKTALKLLTGMFGVFVGLFRRRAVVRTGIRELPPEPSGFKTVLTVYGDSGRRTTEVVNMLRGTSFSFRVCPTDDHPGTPILVAPFGDIVGLDRIRAFINRAKKQGYALSDPACLRDI